MPSDRHPGTGSAAGVPNAMSRRGRGAGARLDLDEWKNGDSAQVTDPGASPTPPPSPPPPPEYRRGAADDSHDVHVTPRGGPETPKGRGGAGGGHLVNGRGGVLDGGQVTIGSWADADSWLRDGAPLDYADDASDIASIAKSIPPPPDEMNFPRVPPQQRVDVVFEDLEVTARGFMSKEKKTLLHSVSGQFRAGELVAVMGPSGAGKTTLLNTISGFTSGMMSGGSLRLQLEDGSVTKKRRVVCYLTQEDHMQSLFTAREAVMHAADLKVGSRLSRKARGLLVDDVLETLGLAGCSCTRISQLSGGQRKRLALATELVDNPRVIFLDEPTTGLDMSTATQCTQLMRRIARSGRAVICTIHQPSESILSMFDQLYLLADGHCVYRGPPCGILPFLGSLGFQCPQYHNPADFMLEVANNEYGHAVEAMVEAVGLQSSEYPPPLPDVKEYEANGKVNGHLGRKAEIETLINSSDYQPSEWERFRVLVTRNLLLQHRDWINTHIKLFASILVGLLIGLLFGPIGNNADRVMSNISVMFCLVLYLSYCPEAPAVMKYGDEIQVVKREWFNNCYHLCTYSLAMLISQLPIHVMTCTILCSITYYMTGQVAEPLRFAHVTMALILTSISAESIGLQFGSLFLKKKIVSLFIASTHLAYLILFSGFLALKPEMPAWFDWGTKVNHMHFALNSFVIATYKGRDRINCPDDVVYCHYREPESILALFGLDDAELWKNILALVTFITLIRITSFVTLNYNVKRVNL